MMNAQHAEDAALAFVRSELKDYCPEVMIMPGSMVEGDGYFIFGYDTPTAVAGDFSADSALAGNTPVLVDSATEIVRYCTEDETRAWRISSRESLDREFASRFAPP